MTNWYRGELCYVKVELDEGRVVVFGEKARELEMAADALCEAFVKNGHVPIYDVLEITECLDMVGEVAQKCYQYITLKDDVGRHVILRCIQTNDIGYRYALCINGFNFDPYKGS